MVEFPLLSRLHAVRDCPILHIKNYIIILWWCCHRHGQNRFETKM